MINKTLTIIKRILTCFKNTLNQNKTLRLADIPNWFKYF